MTKKIVIIQKIKSCNRVSHRTYVTEVLPLRMSMTVKVKLATGLGSRYNMKPQGQDYT